MTINWSDELITDICDHLATGKSLIDVARLQGYPSKDSLYRQMARDEDFATRIARARQVGQHHEVDSMIDMADQATSDDWQVVKLRIWARQWRASKLSSQYGDKVVQEHTGKNGGPIETVGKIDLSGLTLEQKRALASIKLPE